MGAATTLAATLAATAGVIALARFANRKKRDFVKNIRREFGNSDPVCEIEMEKDPETGVFRSKSS